MTSPSPIFVKESITNRELIKVLIQIGFRDESTKERFRFVNDKYNSEITLFARPLDEVVQRIDIAEYSYQLYMQGVIKNEEDIVKKVLKNRAKVRLVANAA